MAGSTPDYASLSPARLLRALFTLTAFAVVWLVASPARADEGLMSAYALFSPAESTESRPAPPPPPVVPETGAPLCDRRGAITFAPPPQMQDLEMSLDTGVSLDDCLRGITATGEHGLSASHGRAPTPQEIFSSSDPATLAAIAALRASARERLPVPDASTSCPASGIRSTLERPPRA